MARTRVSRGEVEEMLKAHASVVMRILDKYTQDVLTPVLDRIETHTVVLESVIEDLESQGLLDDGGEEE